ncbi:hypothetical protein [Nannocystis pusilla]|uniref:hypothetical protein n=1 Tax=Nannocystis pusilla TaxID=889268 RepID=UPI003B80C3D9
MPDRIYRQLGEFFQQADEQILRLTYEIAVAARSLVGRPIEEFYVFSIKNPEKILSATMSWPRAMGAARFSTIANVGSADQVRDTCGVLIRCGLLSAHTNPVAHPALAEGYKIDLPWGKAVPHQIELWKLLYQFLTPFHG